MSILEESFVQLCMEHIKFEIKKKQSKDRYRKLHYAQQSLTTLLGIQSMIDEYPELANMEIYKDTVLHQ